MGDLISSTTYDASPSKITLKKTNLLVELDCPESSHCFGYSCFNPQRLHNTTGPHKFPHAISCNNPKPNTTLLRVDGCAPIDFYVIIGKGGGVYMLVVLS
jgi:hypothetical protein